MHRYIVIDCAMGGWLNLHAVAIETYAINPVEATRNATAWPDVELHFVADVVNCEGKIAWARRIPPYRHVGHVMVVGPLELRQ